jgi:DNA repair exonuclease SbcCD ATPase subunit
MNIEQLEKRVNSRGAISYWEDGVLIGKKCTVCGKDKKMSEFSYTNKKKGTYKANCKECDKQYRKENATHLKELAKQYYKDNIERKKKYCKDNAKHRSEINKRWREDNKEYIKQYHKDNEEHRKEYYKQYRKENVEKIKERVKRYRENNKEKIREHDKQRYKENKERVSERCKQKYKENKERNLQEISKMIEQINPMLKELPIYGYIYKFKNIKTGRVYIGQTIQALKERYNQTNIIKGWVKERKHYDNQKFLDELIEKDFELVEVLDVGICKYHLDKLETHYINYYDSCNNGYNNNAGYHDTNDGLEEFNRILSEHNLKFINGKLIGGDYH